MLLLSASAEACSNVLVSAGASADGNSMIAYNADSGDLHGAVSHWGAARHAAGSMRSIYSWDLGKKLGEIPQPAATYNVIGNANCQGLVIGETTMGGLSELSNVGKDWRNGARPALRRLDTPSFSADTTVPTRAQARSWTMASSSG